VATLLDHVRAGLIDAGVKLRAPDEADVDRFPLWLEPRGGAPAPGEGDGSDDDAVMVCSAFRMPGISTGPWEGDSYRYDNVEIRMRTQRPPAAYALEEAIRPVLHDRRNFDLDGIRIIEAMVYLELAPVGNSSEQGFTFRVEYSLQRYLTDQP
jgi:hypothetical protein